MSSEDADLREYLERPLTAPPAAVLAAIDSGPVDPPGALVLAEVARLLDPTPLPVETGWCTMGDGVGYVAVRTAMPDVSAEMIDWWFDWHPRAGLRYRIWHPSAHRDNSLTPAQSPRAKAHWDTVHHPVEDVGIGVVHARIDFRRPTAMGLPSDCLQDQDVATIVCGHVGDERRHLWHTPMFHVFLSDGPGLVLRSHFWLGAAIRPYGVLGTPGARLLNNGFVRRASLPAKLPRELARHCAEEYTNLAALLPELYSRFGVCTVQL